MSEVFSQKHAYVRKPRCTSETCEKTEAVNVANSELSRNSGITALCVCSVVVTTLTEN